jgi:hypothetical protein
MESSTRPDNAISQKMSAGSGGIVFSQEMTDEIMAVQE